jgi:hypothetical protein
MYILYGSLQFFDSLDIAIGFEVDESPYFVLDDFCLYFLEHGVNLLITEDETVIFRDCLLRGIAFIGKQNELL